MSWLQSHYVAGLCTSRAVVPSLRCQLRRKKKGTRIFKPMNILSQNPKRLKIRRNTLGVHKHLQYLYPQKKALSGTVRDTGHFSAKAQTNLQPPRLPFLSFPHSHPFLSPRSLLVKGSLARFNPLRQEPVCVCWMKSRLRLLQCTDARRAPLSRTKIPRSPEQTMAQPSTRKPDLK